MEGCGEAGTCLSELMGVMLVLEVVCVVGMLQLLQKTEATPGRRPVIFSIATSQLGTGKAF